MNKLLLSLTLISFTSIANAGVYQCKINGSLTYQDKPCANARNGETVGDRIKKEQAIQQEKAKVEQEKLKQMKENSLKYQTERERYKSAPNPYIGMHSGISTKWGEPTTKNVTTTANGTKEQWVYRQGNSKAKYLYFTNGKLTAISE
ncbi:hypothetical protein LF296_12670 [Acinetobacter vivianii]|uniref:DUF4124 domain-containing protein n=1 Tax=Acinetobacter vivianii TaxID=1776742 RepID=A0AAJ6NGU0_9GAMM|nr:DUF4124 domain-containing protein [Acinetobacter vivianii]WDZ50173.1 hypothetical protein LF296_12670 [Acinetobacter vivianii]